MFAVNCGSKMSPSHGMRENFSLDQVPPSRLERSTAEGRGRDAGPSGIRRVPGEWLNASHTQPQSHTMHWISLKQLCYGLSEKQRTTASTLASKTSLATAVLCCLLALSGVEALEIKDLKVPTTVQSGVSGPLILDCDYVYEEKEKNSIVVKWYLETGSSENRTSQQVYQWITTLKPQDLGALKGRLDMHYEASADPHKKYRALSIFHPTVNLTGDYKCHVSSNYNDAVKSQKMIVYSPAKDLNLKIETISSNRVNVSCVGYGLYPKPQIEITAKREGTKILRESLDVEHTLRVFKKEELYDVVAYKQYEHRSLAQETIFECLLTVPETSYSVHKSAMYYPDKDTADNADSAENDPIQEADTASIFSNKKESSLTDTKPTPNGNWQLHHQERTTALLASTMLLTCLWKFLSLCI